MQRPRLLSAAVQGGRRPYWGTQRWQQAQIKARQGQLLQGESNAANREAYTHGHHHSVVSQHAARSAADCAAFLLPSLKRGSYLLDVGCGPGSITAGLAQHVGETGRVVAIDSNEEIVAQAAGRMVEAGIDNVSCEVHSVYELPFARDSFDVAYAHQLLQHLANPVAALTEMRRVVRPGGLLAVRDADYSSMLGQPALPGIDRWRSVYRETARRNGAEPDAGRHLVRWLQSAGVALEDIQYTASAVVYSSANEPARRQWGLAWRDRTLYSAFGQHALRHGIATQADLDAIAAAWQEWADEPAAVFYYVNGEALVRIPE